MLTKARNNPPCGWLPIGAAAGAVRARAARLFRGNAFVADSFNRTAVRLTSVFGSHRRGLRAGAILAAAAVPTPVIGAVRRVRSLTGVGLRLLQAMLDRLRHR